jgi:hypothetical protein
MHHRLLHDALQEEEVRAIVIKVEPELDEEEEEYNAADFVEDLGQDYDNADKEEESEREAHSLVDSEVERPRLCQQTAKLEVDGDLVTVHMLYDWGSTVTLVRHEVAREAGLRPVRVPRWIVKGFEGKVNVMDSRYYLPLLDADGEVKVFCAYVVDEIATVARTRMLPDAGNVFPVIRAFLPWMNMARAEVDSLIGLDNTQWLPRHVEDSWDPDNDMRLMKSTFGNRYTVMGGWGRSLYPRDPPQMTPGSPAEEPAQEEEEVQLEEYHSWSQSSWNRGNDKAGMNLP